MRLVARLLLLFTLATAIAGSISAFESAHAQAGAVPTPQVTSSRQELVRPKSGNDTLKLASLGVVFLVIGAAVVYAPQIVSGITRLPGRIFGSPKKRPVKPSDVTVADTTRQPIAIVEPDVAGQLQATPRAPAVAEQQPRDIVAQLQREVRSAWSKD